MPRINCFSVRRKRIGTKSSTIILQVLEHECNVVKVITTIQCRFVGWNLALWNYNNALYIAESKTQVYGALHDYLRRNPSLSELSTLVA